jgi:hypothetical protein
MKPIFVKMLLFFSLISAVGCSPVYYKPNLANVPNFREKGQAYLAAHITNGGEIQAAYAVNEHFAVLANYETAENPRTTTYSELFSSTIITKKTNTKGALGEFAVGYYAPLDKHLAWGLYGGYGSGYVENNWDFEGASSGKMRKYFLLSTLGLGNKYVEFICSAKLARLNYYDLRQNYKVQEYIDAFNVLKTPTTIVEIGSTLRFGLKNIKIQVQTNLMIIRKVSVPEFPSYPFSVGLGVCTQLNTKRSENKDEIERKKKASKFEWF